MYAQEIGLSLKHLKGTMVSIVSVSYSAQTNCTQKLKLMREGGHFTCSLSVSTKCLQTHRP
jgi:hypothetical protein